MEAVFTGQKTEAKGISRRFTPTKGVLFRSSYALPHVKGYDSSPNFSAIHPFKGHKSFWLYLQFSTSKFLAKYEVTFGQYFGFMGMVVNGIQNKLYCLVGKKVAIIRVVYWWTNLLVLINKNKLIKLINFYIYIFSKLNNIIQHIF